MIKDSFIAGNSIIHRLDPRIKLISITAFSFTVALSHRLPALSVAVCAGLLMVCMARLELRQVAWRMVIINGLVLMLWLVLPLTVKGPAIFSIGPLPVSRTGVALALEITLKSNAIVMALIALVATSSITVLGHAMTRLRVPDKIVYILLMTYRYIFLIEQEYQKLATAARVRCFQPGTNLHTYRTYAWFVGMLFVRAWLRADRVYHAMVCRGFTGKFHCLNEFHLTRADYIGASLMAGIIITVVVI